MTSTMSHTIGPFVLLKPRQLPYGGPRLSSLPLPCSACRAYTRIAVAIIIIIIITIILAMRTQAFLKSAHRHLLESAEKEWRNFNQSITVINKSMTDFRPHEIQFINLFAFNVVVRTLMCVTVILIR